jgi:hypothetical protein
VILQLDGQPIRPSFEPDRVNLISGSGISLSGKAVAQDRRMNVTVSVSAAGATFPTDPDDGATFYRTDLSDLFAYDATRAKWLSVRTHSASFTNGTTLASGNQLRLFQGPTGTTSLGDRLRWDATLVEVSASRATSGVATLYGIQAGAAAKHTHTLGAGVVTSDESGINVDFAADDVVNVLLAADMTGGGTCTCTFRRRAS